MVDIKEKYVTSEEMAKYATDQIKKGNEVYISRVDKIKSKIDKGYTIAEVENSKILVKDDVSDMILLIRKVPEGI